MPVVLASMAHQAKAGLVASTVPFAIPPVALTATAPFEFISENVALHQQFIIPEGIRGTRREQSESAVEISRVVNGRISMNPRPTELDSWLPFVMGSLIAGAGTLTETVPYFDLTIDRVAKVFQYTNCKIDTAVFRASKAGLLFLDVDLEALDEITPLGAAGTFPALTLSVLQPYTLAMAVVTINGTARNCDDIVFTVKHNLVKDRFMNSVYRTELPEGPREVMFSCTIPYTSNETAVYRQAIAGAAATIVFTNGTVSFTITMNRWQPVADSPVVGTKKDEILLRLNGAVRGLTTANEFTVTQDSAP